MFRMKQYLTVTPSGKEGITNIVQETTLNNNVVTFEVPTENVDEALKEMKDLWDYEMNELAETLGLGK